MNQSAPWLKSSSIVMLFACGIVGCGSILFSDTTQNIIATQTLIPMIVTKKKKMGTNTSLLVLFKKSAEASITLIASLRDLQPQNKQQAKHKANTPRVQAPPR